MSSTVVSCVFIFALTTTLAIDLGDNYDVTTVLKLVESSPGVFEPNGALTVVARGKARGLPLRRGKTFINATFAGKPCCASWAHEGWTKLDSAHAQEAKPPLDPHETSIDDGPATNQTIGKTDKLTIVIEPTEEEYTVDSQNTWTGNLPVDTRIRLSFQLRASNKSTLGLYLCDAEDVPNTDCIAFLITGCYPNGSFLQYRPVRLGRNAGGSHEVHTPFGKLRTTEFLDSNFHTSDAWIVGVTYNFLVERSAEGNFRVRLEGGDVEQSRLMEIHGTPTMTRFAAIALPADPNTFLQVKADPTWRGYLRPGGELFIRYTPPASASGYLGMFICSDRFQEDCIGDVMSGHYEGTVRHSTGKYTLNEASKNTGSGTFWVAGMEGKMYNRTELGSGEYVRASWEPVRPYVFAVSRVLDGTVRVHLDGSEDERDQRWATPKEYKHIFIASYRNKGLINVKEALGRCAGSSVCSAPAPLWVLTSTKGELRSPSLPASVAKIRVCVTIVARISPGARATVLMQPTGGTERLEMGVLSIDEKDQTQWITRRMIKNTPRALRGKPVDIVVNVTQTAETSNPVMVQWVTSCNPEGDEDVYKVADSISMKSVSGSTGFDVMVRTEVQSLGDPQPNPACMNGGLLDLVTNKCRCVPGFIGEVCEQGCGPNAFGADCTGKCTRSSTGRLCSGMLLCGAGGVCDCAPGFGGSRCEEECKLGFFGSGCRKSCGHCKDGVACDPYSGHCEGCQGALQPPYCIEECGRSAPVKPLISNGGDAKADDFPWHAGVYDVEFRSKTAKPTDPPLIEQICGATLVKPKLLISAAHCFYPEDEKKLQRAARYKVALGKTLRGWDDQENPPDRVQRRNVLWLHVPAHFRGNLGNYVDDIAVIELDTSVVTTIYVSPICVDWTGLGFDSTLDSTRNGSVVGWGRTEKNEPSQQLKFATLPYISSDECYERVSPSFWPYLNRDKFCAGDNKGASVNNGDSGGGMVFQNRDQNGAWYLRGVVSVGPYNDLSFTAYTNVTSYRQWLTDIQNYADIRAAVVSIIIGVF